MSDRIPVISGVPQVLVLRPLLFSILNVNDLPNVFAYCKYHFFADDLQIYYTCRPTNIESVDRINDDLPSIYKWSLNNGLQLNPGKCKAIFVCNHEIIDVPKYRYER